MGASSDKWPPITGALDPDLSAVRRFIEDMIARGAVVALVAAILALLVRMRDLNTELMRKLAATRRKRPASETMRRLQLELPLILAPAANVTSAANDGATPPPVPPADKPKRGPKKRHAHGRPKLPAHLTRVPEMLCVPEARRTCPQCGAQVAPIRFKTTAEKLDIEPAKYIVRQTQVECHRRRRRVPESPGSPVPRSPPVDAETLLGLAANLRLGCSPRAATPR